MGMTTHGNRLGGYLDGELDRTVAVPRVLIVMLAVTMSVAGAAFLAMAGFLLSTGSVSPPTPHALVAAFFILISIGLGCLSCWIGWRLSSSTSQTDRFVGRRATQVFGIVMGAVASAMAVTDGTRSLSMALTAAGCGLCSWALLRSTKDRR